MSATARQQAAVLAGVRPAAPVRLLFCAFALSNGARVFAYLPTLWAIHAAGASTQHSLWTWGTWLAANLTMAAWLWHRAGGRCDLPVLSSAANAVMCSVGVALIL